MWTESLRAGYARTVAEWAGYSAWTNSRAAARPGRQSAKTTLCGPTRRLRGGNYPARMEPNGDLTSARKDLREQHRAPPRGDRQWELDRRGDSDQLVGDFAIRQTAGDNKARSAAQSAWNSAGTSGVVRLQLRTIPAALARLSDRRAQQTPPRRRATSARPYLPAPRRRRLRRRWA